jgi:hypothetical protein
MMRNARANIGRAELLLCPNLTVSKRSDAGGVLACGGKGSTRPILETIWAARQRRPTMIVDKRT